MARHARRLIFWTTGVLLTLALLALLCIALLLWGIDPDVFRARFERAATDALGRRVELTGPLRWRPGLNFQIESNEGRIGNAAGFGPGPLASWKTLRLGVALRPLLDRRLVVDRIEVEGLRLDLARNARGVNWNLPTAGPRTQQPGMCLAVGRVRLRDAEVRFREEGGATWSVTGLVVDAGMPEKLDAPSLLFTGVAVQARVAGPTLQSGGVALQWSAPRMQFEPSARRLALPEWRLQWSDARASGALQAELGDAITAEGTLHVEAPSLRGLLRSVVFELPGTRDPAVFGPLRFDARFAARGDAATLTQLDAMLDATRVTGAVKLPSRSPLSLRFALTADQVDMDRYRTPENQPTTPLELPLARLKALDAKGSVVIHRATLAGAAARELRIDVD